MFRQGAEKLTIYLVNNRVITRKESDVCSYGLELGIALAVNVAAVLGIGFIVRMLPESVLFLFLFFPLRSYVGGYHASSYARCFWMSSLSVAAVLGAIKMVQGIYSAIVFVCIAMVCAAITFVLVPIQDSNRPLDAIEIRVYGHRARVVLATEILLLIILVLLNLVVASSVVLCTISMVCMLACAGATKNALTSKRHLGS